MTDQVPSGALRSSACWREMPGSTGGPVRSMSGCRFPQRVGEVAATVVPAVGLLRQSPREHRVDGSGQVGSRGGQRRRVGVRVRVEHHHWVFPFERHRARQEFVGHARERVLIGPAVHGRTADLLGGTVVGVLMNCPAIVRPPVERITLATPNSVSSRVPDGRA